MKKRRITLFVVLILGLIVIAYLSHYSRSGISPITYPSELLKNQTLNEKPVIRQASGEDYLKGKEIKAKIGDFIQIKDDEVSLFRLLNIYPDQNKVELSYENDYILNLELNEERKFNPDSDDDYEFFIRLDSLSKDEAVFIVKSIKEPVGIINKVDDRIEGLLIKMEERYNFQVKILIIILGLLLALVFFYIVKIFIVPSIKKHRAIDRQSPSDTMAYLLNEFDEAISERDKALAKKLYSRIRHLYQYLSDEEKERFKGDVERIKRAFEK